MNMSIRTSYLEAVFTRGVYARRVKAAIAALREFDRTHPFGAIAFTGVSGAAFAFPISLALRKPLLCARKRGGSSHTSLTVEGKTTVRTYVIVDDCIDSGKTLRRIQDEVQGETSAKLLGVYLYDCHYLRHEKEYEGRYGAVRLIKSAAVQKRRASSQSAKRKRNVKRAKR